MRPPQPPTNAVATTTIGHRRPAGHNKRGCVMDQRQRVGQTAGHQGRDRVHRRWTTGSPPAMTSRGPSDLRQPRSGPHRRAAAQVAGDPAPPVHARGRDRRLPLRDVDPAGGVLADPMFDRPVVRADLLRAGAADNLDIGRPDQVSLIFDRRIIRTGRGKTPAGSAPGSSPTGSSRRCTSTTRTPRSSSTTRRAGPCAPRPRSTTPASSGCPNG